LKMADTKRPEIEQVNDAQTGAIAQAFVNGDQVHGKTHMPEQAYASSGILLRFRNQSFQSNVESWKSGKYLRLGRDL
jgi:hypothetical protein